MPELNLRAVVTADGSGLSNTLRGLGSDVQGFAKKLSSIQGALSGVLAGVGLVTVAQWIRGVVEEAGNLQDKFEQTGIAASILEEIGHVANRSGSSLNAMVQAFEKLAEASVKANSGDKGLLGAFSELGISAEELRNMKIEDIFFKIAAGMKEANISAEKLTALKAVLGGKSSNLIPAFRSGFDKPKGATNTDIAARELDSFSDSASDKLKTLKGTFRDIIAGGVMTATNWKRYLSAVLTTRGSIVDAYRAGMKEMRPSFGPSEKPLGVADMLSAEEKAKLQEAIRKAKEKADEDAAKREAEKAERVTELRRRIADNQAQIALDALTVEKQIVELRKKSAELVKAGNKELVAGDQEKGLELLLKASEIDSKVQSLLNTTVKGGERAVPEANKNVNELQRIGALSQAPVQVALQKEANKTLRDIEKNTKPTALQGGVIFK